jgi:vitamin B12/bleomycin/antimicrobial peptide transport system ATP-binding/permease protein
MRKVGSGFWRDVWELFKPYWFAKDSAVVQLRWIRLTTTEKVISRLLLLVIVALTLGMVYMEVLFNAWQNLFFNTFQDKDKVEFYNQILRFGLLATIWIVMAVYTQYLTQMLQIRWRRWLTRRYLREWLTDRTYYRMQLVGAQTDNPDQRVAEDLKIFVDETLNLSLGLLNAVVTLISFVGILWVLSGPLTVPLAGREFVIPGYMVWVVLVYATIGTWLTHKVGWPLIGLNFNQQRFEADFRYNLVRFRENMEGVALYRGEEDELTTFRGRFMHVVENWWSIMQRQKKLTWFTSGYAQVAVIFPYVVAAPRFFSGAIALGGLMQTASAFGQVRVALSWFIGAYTSFAAWKATVDRLTGFHKAIVAAQEHHRTHPGIAVSADGGGQIELDHVELDLPNGQPLLSNAKLSIAAGARILLQGASGCGKSTLFRAIAGIWPFGRGHVRVPKDFRALFLPQRPYFPLGTLRCAVAYPAASDAFSDDEVMDALTAVGLPHFIARLDESANWGMQFSGGEQQRVAFARALLQKPAWLFLDEATSNLDDASQAQLYEVLTQRLKGTAIVSIAHRDELAPYHAQHVELHPTAGGTHELLAEEPQPVERAFSTAADAVPDRETAAAAARRTGRILPAGSTSAARAVPARDRD